MCFNPNTELFHIYQHDTDNPNSISWSAVNTVYKDRVGILWVSTWQGLNKWDKYRYRFSRISRDTRNSLSRQFGLVYSVIEDSDGFIWFTNADGLYRFSRHSNEFQNYKLDSGRGFNSVTYVYRDESGINWFGALYRGFVRHDPVLNTYQLFSNDPSDSTTISHNLVVQILPDGNDALWIGTFGGGLTKGHDQQAHST